MANNNPVLTFDAPRERYAVVVIENVSLNRGGGAPFQPPPLRDPVLRVRPSATAQDISQQNETLGRSNTGWFEAVYNELKKRWNGTQVTFEAPSIDELDPLYFGRGTVDGSTDPVTFTATWNASSAFGRTLQVGDYILWNDPQIYGSAPNQYWGYEIDKVTAYNSTTGAITLQRRERGAATGMAFYETHISAHTNCTFFPLIHKVWTESIQPQNGIQPLIYPWDNMCFWALRGTPSPGDAVTLTFPPAFSNETPAPGRRTMNGNQYILGTSGAFGVGSTSSVIAPVAGPESIRAVIAEARYPVDSDTVIRVVYMNSSRTLAGIVDEVTILAGQKSSYLTQAIQPNALNMPYRSGGITPNLTGTQFPPNILCQLTGALTGGILAAAGTVAPSQYIQYEFPGYLDYYIVSGSGNGLSVGVLT